MYSQQYPNRKKKITVILMGLLLALSLPAQVIKTFNQRTSVYTPTKKVYSIKGDYNMIGNTNLTLQTYTQEGQNGNSSMVYVDIDGDPNTLNSSSAVLGLSAENGALPACSKILYAGLYWTGRAHDGSSPNTFPVSKLLTGQPPQTVSSQPFTVSNANALNDVQYSTYSMAITRSGSSGSYTVRYSFTSSGNTTYLFEFQNTTSNWVRYSTNGGSTWTTAGNQSATTPGTNLSQVSFTPVPITVGSLTVAVSSLVRDIRKDQSLATYQATATASGTVSGTTGTSYYINKNYDKSIVYLKHENATGYTQVSASDAGFTTNIYYPTSTEGSMYTGYAEITDYVNQNGVGNYFVADMALQEGNGGGTGYYGGWGMVVVYENQKMNPRDVTLFDGFAYLASNGGAIDLPVSGFNTARTGPINIKLGVLAGEGDRPITGDYFWIRDYTNTNWIQLSHSGNTTTNFFNSSIATGGNTRIPNLLNNTGLDLSMFYIPNTNNSVITNNQTFTTFRYGTTGDTYIISCIAMAVDAYVPEIEAENLPVLVNGAPYSSSNPLHPGDLVTFTTNVYNRGTEVVNNSKIKVPMPYIADYYTSSATVNFSPAVNTVNYYPAMGATGTLVWDIGNLPVQANKETILGTLTYTVRVTTDCNTLKTAACGLNLTIDGDVSGQGATSQTVLTDKNFIEGYSTSGDCKDVPNYSPVNFTIDAAAYVSTNCSQTPVVKSYTYCNVSSGIPITEVTGYFPAGSRFYSEYPLEEPYTEYTISNPFPATVGSTTYYAIPPGSTSCFYEFQIIVSSITSTPTVTSPLTLCQNEPAAPLTATKTNSSYTLYYYTTATGGSPLTSLTPATSAAGTFTYYAAEGLSPQCVSPNRAAITVNVVAQPASPAVTNQTFCPLVGDKSYIASATSGHTLQWYTTATGGTASTSTPSTITTDKGVFTMYVSQKSNTSPFCESPRVPVTITVANNEPDPVNDIYSTLAGKTVSGNVLINDNDGDAEWLTVAAVTNGSTDHGTYSISNSGIFTYTPTAGYTGTDTFTYMVNDHCTTATATVTITINACVTQPAAPMIIRRQL